MDSANKLDCQSLSFSSELSLKRLNKAQLIFGEKVLKRIIVFCLYVLGVRRNEISEVVKLPENTVRTMIKAISSDGVAAFFDRRKKNVNSSKSITDQQTDTKPIQINELHDGYKISICNKNIFVPHKNKDQLKAVLLTFAENRLISKTQAGKLLGVSSSHVGYLINDMSENDLSCLIDKRRGQQKDYVFTPEIKSELIVQFSINAAMGKSTSSSVLASDLEHRTTYKLSERGIRYHISNLGLKGKGAKLWELIGLKKTL
ncbi:MAG: hypothetical protein PF590_09450 [Candidatus Delongbacteria bacterium]|jgi:hypothetical protein|nr:hypothetical protein [Candidatus Delongbacteria bacterium]